MAKKINPQGGAQTELPRPRNLAAALPQIALIDCGVLRFSGAEPVCYDMAVCPDYQ